MNNRPDHHPDEPPCHHPVRPVLVYHRFFKTFSGYTPEDVVLAIHDDAQLTTRQDFATWWTEQTHLWRHKYNVNVPTPTEPHAAQTLLNILVDAGVLTRGPQLFPPQPTRPGPAAFWSWK